MRIHDPQYLKLYLPLNGPARDGSGNGWPIANDTITDYLEGPFGKQIPVFNGSTGQIEFASGMEHPFNWDGFTVSFWSTRADWFNGISGSIYVCRNTDSTEGFEVRKASGGSCIFASYPGNIHGANTTTISAVQDSLLHIVLTFRKSDRAVEWFVNAELNSSGTKSLPVDPPVDNDYRHGISYIVAGTRINGSIWNFRLYNTILTPEEIKQLHFHEQTNKKVVSAPELPLTVTPDNSDPTLQLAIMGRGDPLVDSSMYGRSVTLSKIDADYVNLKGGGLKKYNADGAPSGDRVIIGTMPDFQSYTLCFWWKCTFITSGNKRVWISNNVTVNQAKQTSSTNLNWELNDGSGNVNLTCPSPLNTWSHFAFVFDRNNEVRSIYRNGVLVGSASLVGFAYPQSLNTLYLLTTQAEGEMKDARVYSRVLTPSEIKSVADRSNPEPDLILHTNDGLKDLSVINHTLTPIGSPIELGNGFKSGFYLDPNTSSYIEAENKGYWTDMDLTFSFWMKVINTRGDLTGFIARHATTAAGYFAMSVHANDSTFSVVWTDSGSNNVTATFSNPRLFGWCHYTVRAKRNGVNKIYINGELSGQYDFSNAGSPTNTVALRFGNQNNIATLGSSVIIKDLRAYTGEKSAEWVKDYYLKTKDGY